MERQIEKVLISRLNKWRCVAILGARQVGKTYLIKEVLKHYNGSLISFDDPLERVEASKDPVGYLNQRYKKGSYLFIDEAARVPEIFSAAMVLVDRMDPVPTGICLANSGNYLLLKRIKESLAGRVNLISMFPFSWQETGGAKRRPGLLDILLGNEPVISEKPISFVDISRTREDHLLWGGFPTPFLNAERNFKISWSRDYVRTYITPLVIEQFGIRDAAAFERAAQILFTQSAQFFNASHLAKLSGVAQPTAMVFMHHLEAMMIIERLQIYAQNPLKRVVKQPKIHVTDPILTHQPMGTLFSIQTAVDRGLVGPLYESFVIGEIKKTIANYDMIADFYAWRTEDKSDVDIVLATPDGVCPIEIKWSKKISTRDASGLKSFMSCYSDVKRGYIVYPGEEILRISQNVFAVPDWWVLGV